MKKQAMKTRSAVMRLITNQRRQVIAWLIPAAGFCRLPMKDEYRVARKARWGLIARACSLIEFEFDLSASSFSSFASLFFLDEGI